MKKLINKVEDLVPESLAGLGAAHPDLVKIDAKNNVVLRAGGPKQGKVGLISGGGSGHEPMHGGFVGLGHARRGLLPATSSPRRCPDQMEAATRAVDGGAGVLHIVKNYTGDVLNFQMAAELVAGEIEVASVVTNDDVAVQDSLYTAGRRGVGVTVLAREDRGRARRGRRLARRRHRDRREGQRPGPLDGPRPDRAASSRPPARRPSRSATTRSRSGSASTASRAGGARSSRRSTRWPSGSSRRSSSDLGLTRGDTRPRVRQRHGRHAAHRAVRRVQQRRQDPRGQGISIGRSLVGNYITSLEMAGFSVTLLKLDDELDAAVGCAGPHAGPPLGRLTLHRSPRRRAVAPARPGGRLQTAVTRPPRTTPDASHGARGLAARRPPPGSTTRRRR